MKVVKTIAELKEIRKSLSGTVGFVPTMGYLHVGHISLVNLAKKENDHVIVSVFVNPKQFGPNDDFAKYPRDTERDSLLLEQAGTDILFLPEVEDLYPDDFETEVSLNTITKPLEGERRPGHFTGVATVLVKLFNLTQPTKSYFGQKDAQQVAVVKKLVEDLNIPLEIVVGEIIREADGLAMSSRNVFLSETERKEAGVIYQSLSLAKRMFADGEKNTANIRDKMSELIKKTSGEIDYISVADLKTLEEREVIEGKTLVSLVVKFGKTRLLDNIILG